jgi:two-component sensor histidine kinase
MFPDDIHHERGRILRDAMERRTTVKGEAVSIVGPWVSYCLFPLGDGLGVILHDVSDRYRAEESRDEALGALHRRTAELEAVLEMIPTAVWFTYDPLARQIVTNRRAAELLRLPYGTNASLTGPQAKRPTFRFYKGGQQVPATDLPMQRAARGEEATDEVLELRFENGDRKILLVRAVTLRDAAGAIQGAVAAAADVTDRHRYEDHLRLLLDELNHRVKNTLAIVQSIAYQTLRSSGDPAEARQRFEGRLLALSKAHDVLTRERWQRASLRQVIDEAISPYAGTDSQRFEVSGPDLAVPPKHALALAMAFHELCANAVKHGALSRLTGTVGVDWRLEERDGARFLSLCWTERGGPLVGQPTRRGFGSRLLEHGLPQDLRGTVRLEFAAPGVICRIEAPMPGETETAIDPESNAIPPP